VDGGILRQKRNSGKDPKLKTHGWFNVLIELSNLKKDEWES